jgi:hypothetical protein
MKRWICILLSLLVVERCLAQHDIQVYFTPQFQSAQLTLDSIYHLPKEVTFQLSTFKLYISNIQFFKQNMLVDQDSIHYRLLNMENPLSMQFTIPRTNATDYNEIRFNLGIDSFTNVSGAMGGDLDPTQGMYWTWQNGYINFKLEGKASKSTARNHSFEFHIGGYVSPFATIQTITFNTENQGQIHIDIDIEKLIRDIDFSTFNHVMSPGVEAVKLSEKVNTIFSLHQ